MHFLHIANSDKPIVYSITELFSDYEIELKSTIRNFQIVQKVIIKNYFGHIQTEINYINREHYVNNDANMFPKVSCIIGNIII